MKQQLTKLISLPGLIVKSYKQLENTLILEIQNKSKTAFCPKCKKCSSRLHQNHYSLIKDIPWGENEVLLRINRRQFKCDNCLTPFSEELDFVKKRQKHTLRYAQFITEQVVNSDLKSVAKRNNLTESEIESMIDQISLEICPISLNNLKRLGIDEISLVKGQGKFIIVLVDLDTGKLIGLVKERKAKTLEDYLKSWGEEILNNLEEVSIDLYKMYKTVIEKNCPQAVITADRFHVTKILHQELNQGRIEQKKTAESLEAKPREKLFSTFKGGKYILLKKEKDLNDKQKQKLSDMKNASATIEVMHQLKEEFSLIFDSSQNLGEGTLKLAEWLIKAQSFFPKTVKTIKNWFVEIVGYFEQRTTNAVVEGINNRLKVLKRCGFGFRNFDNFKKRALLFWHLTDSLA
jgi:transposase